MSVIALIPARSGSKGIPGKNFKRLGGKTLVEHAVRCAAAIPQCDLIVVSSDLDLGINVGEFRTLRRPDNLAQDDTPMIDVVKHAMTQIPGAPDDIWVLLQPTQPLRTPQQVKDAIALLESSGADSVVSVVALPLTHHPQMQIAMMADGRIEPFTTSYWANLPTRRQDLAKVQTYKRDGTVYAFWRKTLETPDYRGECTMYGQDVRPLIIDPRDTVELDTEEQWAALEARWKERG